jgi:tRNA-splicing ligase RtcB
MLGVVNKGRVPIKLWSPVHEVESAAIDQLVNTSTLPCVFKHVAVMPDVHLGKGATVGSVVATKHALVPAAVGVDIGCGMIAARMPMSASELPSSLSTLRSEIESRVPVGFNKHTEFSRHEDNQQTNHLWHRFTADVPMELIDKFPNVRLQLGTLGGGNHFIEVCLDAADNVWLVLHSGSRNIGKEIAEVHINEAKGLMRKYFISLPDPDLAYLVEGTLEFRRYWDSLQWAQDYAAMNREMMLRSVIEAMNYVTGQQRFPLQRINCHHNYAAKEHHFGEDVYVTRKGAVRARVGDFGIIPGSMGTRSYIVKGLGNPDSFNSCSHGAGRRMSRGKAKEKFTVEDLQRQTAGVECRKDAGVLDEIPGAYKDIDQVMENQKDLVEIVATLRQVLCVKG